MELTNLRTMTDLDIAETEEESWLFAYSAFQIDESHRHNQNLVGTLHKAVPTVVDRHEKCCKEKS